MEIWDIYSIDKIKTGRTHIRGQNLNPGDYHLVVVIWIINSNGQFLVTKKHPQKEVFPYMWECTAGSVISGEESISGALREVKEEIGIILKKEKGKLIKTFLGNDTIYDYWLFIEEIKIEATELQKEEVIDIKLVSYEELKNMFQRKELIPHLKVILPLIDEIEEIHNLVI